MSESGKKPVPSPVGAARPAEVKHAIINKECMRGSLEEITSPLYEQPSSGMKTNVKLLQVDCSYS